MRRWDILKKARLERELNTTSRNSALNRKSKNKFTQIWYRATTKYKRQKDHKRAHYLQRELIRSLCKLLGTHGWPERMGLGWSMFLTAPGYLFPQVSKPLWKEVRWCLLGKMMPNTMLGLEWALASLAWTLLWLRTEAKLWKGDDYLPIAKYPVAH